MAGFVAFTNAPPFQVNVLPALVPLKVDVNAVHVILPELVADVITGNVVLLVTDTTEVVTHPLLGFVAVTVYTPDPNTVMLWVVAPFDQRFPTVAVELSITDPPAQKVVGPLAEITGVAVTGFIVKVNVVVVLMQFPAFFTVRYPV